MKVIKPNTIAYPDGSFSRGTIGTYFDVLGVMQTAAINSPRFTYNPTTLAFEGLLIEQASTNLITYSAQFDNAAWTKSASTVTANAVIAPDGTTTADKLVENTSNSQHLIIQNITLSTGTYCFSGYLKAGERNLVQLNRTDTGGFGAQFNLTTGSVLGFSGFTSVTLTAINNGWYRFSAILTLSTGATVGYGLQPLDATGAAIYTGNGTSGIYLWGAQVEAGSKATSCIATTSASVLRNADVITGTGLIYTTVTDSTAVYSSGTTYAANALVRYNATIYQSLQATNVNHQPDISPTWWIELYADNMHAAFDTQTSTISSAITSMTFVVKPGSFDSAALINLETALVEIAVSDDNTKQLVYNSSAGLADSTLQDWYQYFFYDPLVHRTQVVFYNIPPYTEAVVTVRLTGSALSVISVAQAIFGTIASLGGTQYGAQAGIVDYSRKDTDEFGTTSFTKRAFSKRLTADIYINNAELNRVQNYLYNIRATPTVWIASDDPQLEEVSIIWGFYKDFSTTISYPSNSLCNLQIEGLT